MVICVYMINGSRNVMLFYQFFIAKISNGQFVLQFYIFLVFQVFLYLDAFKTFIRKLLLRKLRCMLSYINDYIKVTSVTL